MIGMGYLRLNRVLAKHKWSRKYSDRNDGGDEGTEVPEEHRESPLVLWLVVMALVFLSLVVFGFVRIRQLL